MTRKKNFKVLFISIGVLSLVIVITLIYAGFTGQLNITGTAVGRDSNWDIHFENVSSITTTGTAKVLSNHQPVINSNNPTQIEDYEVSLTSPSDSISFTFDVVNNGNYNAKITSVSVGTPQCTSTDSVSAVNMCNNLTYTLKYSSGAAINQNSDIVYAKDKVTMKVTLTFNDIIDASLLPTAGVSISNLGIQINFEQQGNALVKDNGEVADYRVYHQGDKITLNNEDYWVIANSGTGQDYVVALKNDSLTSMSYGSTAIYDESDVKSYVDNWATSEFQNNELEEVDGYSVRLITRDEYINIAQKYSWSYSFNYWMMSVCNLNYNWVCSVETAHPGVARNTPTSYPYNVRPVINVYKSALETNNNE